MQEYFKNPDDQRPGPNCGVTATAICAGSSFARAWNIWKQIDSHYRAKQWRGRTSTAHQQKALEKLGLDATLLEFSGNLESFCKKAAQHGKVYMVTTSGHVQTIMNGEAIDQEGKKPIAEFWGRRKRVKKVWLINNPFKHAMASKEVPAADLLPKQQPKRQQQGPAPTTLFPALFRETAPHTAAATQLNLF